MQINTNHLTAVFISSFISSAASAGEDPARDALISASDKWFHLVLWMAGLVAVGCIMEVFESLVEYLHWRWRRENKPFQEDDGRWTIPVSILGVVLVIAGVAGEVIFEAKQSTAETAVREYDERILAQNIKEAGEAKDSAKAARISATEAGDVGEAAKKKADVVGLEVSLADKKVEEVDKRATQIDQALDMAQYFLSDRDIRDPDGLKARLAKFAGKTIFFRSYVNDGDGYFLCKELDWLAGSAGIIPTDQCGLFVVEPPYPMTQINVFAPDDDTMLSLESVMAGATAFGAASGPAGNAVHASSIIVFVGRKNRAFVGETNQTRDAEKRAATIKRQHPTPQK